MSLFNSREVRKILFVTPESSPFAKAGGLGEVVFSLSQSLKKQGHDVRLMMPRYAGIDSSKFKLTTVLSGLEVPTDSDGTKDNEPQYLTCNVKKYTSEKENPSKEKLPVTTYFLENQEYFEKRSNVYGYTDDAIRWALLSRGTLEFLRICHDWVPDVIITSDWQTSFLVNYLRTVYKSNKRLSSISTIFIIHNLYYQGMFDHRFISQMDFDDGQSLLPPFFDQRFLKINGMKRGIMYSDMIVTVSPTYAKEITTKDYGELLDDLLKERRTKLYGILNGIDYSDFNPKTDNRLIKNFTESTLDNRIENKLELQNRFGLKKDKNVPVVGIVSRLVEQKGFDLLPAVLEPLLKELVFQLVVVGSGETKYMGYFKDLADRFPQQVAVHLNFDIVLPRLVFGGADMILVPSKFEPCGLTQMEAMHYGAIPIVRRTGGLADSVVDFDGSKNVGNGFSFVDFNSMSLTIVIARAIENYKNSSVWREIQKRAMNANFSWDASAEEYSKIIEEAIKFRGQKLLDSRE